jgi:hypothetical protein
VREISARRIAQRLRPFTFALSAVGRGDALKLPLFPAWSHSVFRFGVTGLAMIAVLIAFMVADVKTRDEPLLASPAVSAAPR